MWGTLGEGGVHSCQDLLESWDWPAFKTCDLLGDTCTLNPSNKEKASCWHLCNVIYFLTLQMFIEHF